MPTNSVFQQFTPQFSTIGPKKTARYSSCNLLSHTWYNVFLPACMFILTHRAEDSLTLCIFCRKTTGIQTFTYNIPSLGNKVSSNILSLCLSSHSEPIYLVHDSHLSILSLPFLSFSAACRTLSHTSWRYELIWLNGTYIFDPEHWLSCAPTILQCCKLWHLTC